MGVSALHEASLSSLLGLLRVPLRWVGWQEVLDLVLTLLGTAGKAVLQKGGKQLRSMNAGCCGVSASKYNMDANVHSQMLQNHMKCVMGHQK